MEEEPDAHAPDAQPIEVSIPKTYHWGVVAAQLEAWQYKSSEKTAQGTLDELRSLVDWTDVGNQCVWQSIKSASLTRGGKESVANGLVTIIIEEYDIHTTSTLSRGGAEYAGFTGQGDAEARAVQLIRELLHEQEMLSLETVERELRRQGLAARGGLESTLLYLSACGFEWVVTDAGIGGGATERVVALI